MYHFHMRLSLPRYELGRHCTLYKLYFSYAPYIAKLWPPYYKLQIPTYNRALSSTLISKIGGTYRKLYEYFSKIFYTSILEVTPENQLEHKKLWNWGIFKSQFPKKNQICPSMKGVFFLNEPT